MKKLAILVCALALVGGVMVGCSGASSSSAASSASASSASASASSASASASSASASASSASASASSASASSASASASSAASSGALTVDKAAKTVTIQAVATGSNDDSVHFLANEAGSNAGGSFFTTTATSQELYDALISLGATPGNNIKIEDETGINEGSDLDLVIEFDGKSFTPGDLVSPEDKRPTQARFGGNIEVNLEKATGCLFCMESCSIGITSDAAYAYKEPMKFPPSENMPAAGTPVTFVYTVK